MGKALANQRKAPSGANPTARCEQGGMFLSLDGVAALPVFALSGLDREPHLLADGAADETAHAVGLPTCGLHQFLHGGSAWALEQIQDFGSLTALTDTLGLRRLGAFLRFGALLCGGGLLARLAPWRASHGASVAQRWPSWWLSAPGQLQSPGPFPESQQSMSSCSFLLCG